MWVGRDIRNSSQWSTEGATHQRHAGESNGHSQAGVAETMPRWKYGGPVTGAIQSSAWGANKKGRKSVVKGREACDGGVLVSSTQVARRPHRSSSPFHSASRASHARSPNIIACRPPDWFALRQNTCRRSPNPRATRPSRGRPAHATHDAHTRCRCTTQASQIPCRHRDFCDTAQATGLARLLAGIAALPPLEPVAAQAV